MENQVTNMCNYAYKQVLKIDRKTAKIKLTSDNGSTNWLTISEDQAHEIAKILKK